MSRLLIDAMAWNYVAKARVLDKLLRSLPEPAIMLPPVARQLEPALAAWPELSVVLNAAETGLIEETDLAEEEYDVLAQLDESYPGLGSTDCALLAVAQLRNWSLLTCDDRLRKTAIRLGITLVDLTDILDRAVSGGQLSEADRDWVVYYSQGGTRRRSE